MSFADRFPVEIRRGQARRGTAGFLARSRWEGTRRQQRVPFRGDKIYLLVVALLTNICQHIYYLPVIKPSPVTVKLGSRLLPV